MRTGADADGGNLHDAQTEVWWSAVLSGQPAASHPTHSGLRARLSRSTLVLSGAVTTASGHQDVLREADTYCAATVSEIQDDIQISGDRPDEVGILSQTVFATFEDPAQAERAAGVLREVSTIATDSLVVLGGPDSPGPLSLPEAYRAKVIEAVAAGRGVLVATVDETEALALREVLDQDTSSIETVVAPPEAIRSGVAHGTER